MAFITIKKKTLVIVLALVLAAVTVAATAATVIAATRSENGMTIVVDPGHGGADGGMVGANTGAKESDVNLAIAKYLVKFLRANGYNTVMTRSDAGAAGGGIKYSKREDMKARMSVMSAAAPDLVISVHCNSYPVKSVSGAQVFYAKNATSGKSFAECVQKYFNDILNEKPRTAAVGDYYVLNCTEYPSILCECGFLSNSKEENMLVTASYQEKVAYTIYTAVNAIFFETAFESEKSAAF